MIVDLPPAIVFFIFALVAPFFRGRAKRVWLVAAPLVAFYVMAAAPDGTRWSLELFGGVSVFSRLDPLARVFGFIFSITAFTAMLFALEVDDDPQHVASLVYVGGALGVILAGDFFSLYIYWEIMAVASTFLILARRTPEARSAALRYILFHLAGGLFLLAGILIRRQWSGTLAVGPIELGSPGSWLILIGIGVNAAMVPVHTWLKDAYPRATATGAVFLSAFTTKSAVYLLARTLAGSEFLIWVGAIMIVIPLLYTVLEDDLRAVLSYSLINQVGFMVCGIGIGTHLAVNGAAAHAFSHILYKSLLFMAAGSVLTVTGRIRFTDLGGLYRSMPWTAFFYVVGALSMSAPLFCAFVSKSMILSAAGHEGLAAVWLVLVFGSAGVFMQAGVKAAYFVFWGEKRGAVGKDPPWNMRLAMGLTALLCLGVGVRPGALYALLPYPAEYAPYTADHVIGQLQLLLFVGLAFGLLLKIGWHPLPGRWTHLDFDWLYRGVCRWLQRASGRSLDEINRKSDVTVKRAAGGLAAFTDQGPARIIWWLMGPFYRLRGLSDQFLKLRREKLNLTLGQGYPPVGLAAGAAAVMLLLVYLAL